MHPLQAPAHAADGRVLAPARRLAGLQPPSGQCSMKERCGRRAHETHYAPAQRRCRAGWAVRSAGSLDPPPPPAAAASPPAEGVAPELDEETIRKAEEFKQLNRQIEETAREVKERLGGTSIYLVGMMGSGKSTVGKLVARALDYPFLDADAIAEQHFGRKIADIFREDGEEGFRELESAVLQALMPHTSCVVATGGGAVTRRKNWGFMQHAIVVWLEGPPELLARRACSQDLAARPLLAAGGDEAQAQAGGQEDAVEATRQQLAAILEERREQYAQADLTVPLGDQEGSPLGAPVSVVAFRLLRALNGRLKKDKKFEPGTPPQQQEGRQEPPGEEREFKGFGQPRR